MGDRLALGALIAGLGSRYRMPALPLLTVPNVAAAYELWPRAADADAS